MKTKQQANGPKARVGVLGMGIMGGAMAETLLAHDFAVTGFDIDPKARARLKKAGGKAMSNVADVALMECLVLATHTCLQGLGMHRMGMSTASLQK